MKKLLVFTTTLCLVLASCTPTSFLGVTGSVGPAANPTATAPQAAVPSPQTATATPGPQQAAAPAAKGIPNFDHIVMIMLENRSYTNAVDGQQMPQLTTLAQQNVLLSNYFAVAHPSLPNYIALMSGSTQGITSDCTDLFCQPAQPGR